MEELTIRAHTHLVGNSWVLFIFGRDVPKEINGSENLEPQMCYRIRLRNTNNLDIVCKNWQHKLTNENIIVDIDTNVDNVSILKDKNNKYILNVKLPDTADIEFWYGGEW